MNIFEAKTPLSRLIKSIGEQRCPVCGGILTDYYPHTKECEKCGHVRHITSNDGVSLAGNGD